MIATDLEPWVTQLSPAAALPVRHRREADTVRGPLRLVAALPLGPRHCLAVVADDTGRRYPVPVVLGDDGSPRRAAAGDGAAAALIHLLRKPAGQAPIGFDVEVWHSEACSGERAVDVDQTNESVVVGGRAVVKWTVRYDLGPSPVAARIAALADAGFDGMPRPWGMVHHEAALLVTVTDLLPGAVDGWQWGVADVGAYARGELTLDAALTSAAALGALTARMHRALHRRGVASRSVATSWRNRAEAELEEALARSTGAEGAQLSRFAERIREELQSLADAAGTPLSDVHGDLHVGQVLRWQPAGTDGVRYAITDFDGNPLLPPDQQVEPQPAAVDVAGLLQSLDHVGRVVVKRVSGADPSLVARWTRTAQVALLDAYRDIAGEDLLDESLLRPLRLRQVVREHLYAARHLPEWSYVPFAALPALMAEDR